jgi:hypothetical protein
MKSRDWSEEKSKQEIEPNAKKYIELLKIGGLDKPLPGWTE